MSHVDDISEHHGKNGLTEIAIDEWIDHFRPTPPEAPLLKQKYKRQWVDWGDHTTTVDPMKHAYHVHDDDKGMHQRTEARAHAFEAFEVHKLASSLPKTVAPPRFEPTVAQVESATPFAHACIEGGNGKWRGSDRDTSRMGALPVIEKLKRTTLQEKSAGDIDIEIREEERRRAARVFSCD